MWNLMLDYEHLKVPIRNDSNFDIPVIIEIDSGYGCKPTYKISSFKIRFLWRRFKIQNLKILNLKKAICTKGLFKGFLYYNDILRNPISLSRLIDFQKIFQNNTVKLRISQCSVPRNFGLFPKCELFGWSDIVKVSFV